jgi:uncharacterized protein with GYD domain
MPQSENIGMSQIERSAMALFMSRFTYTAESWSDLVKHPEDRTKVVGEMLERHGCRLEHLWYAFGEDDGYAVIEAPDNVTMASVALAITSSGAMSSFKTSVLMSQEETMQALGRASDVGYARPGQAVHA